VRLVIDELRRLTQDRGVPVRLLTTTFAGSTEPLALDRLVDAGVDVRVSYDIQTTRLHAKAWIFHRDSGFSTAYVGSSNVSRAALVDGREWNVRIARAATPALYDKVTTAFETQWASGDYAPYDPAADRDLLVRALTQGRGDAGDEAHLLSGLELRPWPYQQEILDALDAERRVHGRHRNLVVAPTGTGKTVVAALDYRRLVQQAGHDLSLLFVAHREQILSQSRRTFREALGDGSFGEMLVGGQQPERGRHVFASIQTLHARDVATIDPRAFDVVMVDEFHHAEAGTYQRLLDHLDPQVLLALTATPERADGLDIRRWTHGRTAFDMRLWHALDRQLLAPFQYFGIADTVDLRDVPWRAGQYVAHDLDRVYSADDAHARTVLTQLGRVVADPTRMAALGFCASVAHAHFMARRFTEAGLPAVAIDGTTPQAERDEAVRLLRARELVAVFTRDVFNEGVDIPEVDTILLLRPTQSVTVHLQQIGRGLRRAAGKDVCTILDFVAQHRQEYRFDLQLRALTGLPRQALVEATEQGFPYLPTGCHIQLDQQSRQRIVDNLKAAVALGRRALVRELQIQSSSSSEPVTLRRFVEDAGIELGDVAKAGGWTRLRRDAGFESREPGAQHTALQRGLGRLLHLDDAERIDVLEQWLASGLPTPLEERTRRIVWSALVTAYGLHGAPASWEAAVEGLRGEPALVEEWRATLPLLRDDIRRVAAPLPDPEVPLAIGATYTRDEILAAFGRLEPGVRYSHQAGPWFHEPAGTEVLFITLRKTERDYSPTTMYRDYAISPELFHWESPHTTRQTSAPGQRWLQQRTNGLRVLLAVREHKLDAWGATAPYALLGPADLVSAEGERPIAITWRLRTPHPR
jgi:superfamily II DNA or RNA helicase